MAVPVLTLSNAEISGPLGINPPELLRGSRCFSFLSYLAMAINVADDVATHSGRHNNIKSVHGSDSRGR